MTKDTKQLGRPPALENARPVNIMLPSRLIAIARRLGKGNISAGVRAALERMK